MQWIKKVVAVVAVAVTMGFAVAPVPVVRVVAVNHATSVSFVCQSFVPAAEAQIVVPGTTGLGTNVDSALLAGTTGVNWMGGAAVTIGLILIGLAVLGGLHRRARLNSPK
jgi:hypothetical protein